MKFEFNCCINKNYCIGIIVCDNILEFFIGVVWVIFLLVDDKRVLLLN